MKQIPLNILIIIIACFIFLIPKITVYQGENLIRTRNEIKNKIQRIVKACKIKIKSKNISEGFINIKNKNICVKNRMPAIGKINSDNCHSLSKIIDLESNHKIHVDNNHMIIYINNSNYCQIKLSYSVAQGTDIKEIGKCNQ